jgi:hypothetical protein
MNSIPPLLLVGYLALGCACTSLQPTEASPEEVQRKIVAEGLLAPGDSVRIVTADGATHRFRILAVDLDTRVVAGKSDAVPIAEIVAVETREFATGKTAALALGGPSGVLLAMLLAAGFAF